MTYTVVGWYSEPGKDYLNTVMTAVASPTKEKKLDMLQKEFNWTIPSGAIDGLSDLPSDSLYYARIDFNAAANPSGPDASGVSISVGNTGTEALSAYLGQSINSTYKQVIEEQLEAMHMASGLEHRQLDIGPKFMEARHEKGFIAVSSGHLWSLRPKSDHTLAPDATHGHERRQVKEWGQVF